MRLSGRMDARPVMIHLFTTELYWSESDIVWNGYVDLPVVCLH